MCGYSHAVFDDVDDLIFADADRVNSERYGSRMWATPKAWIFSAFCPCT